MPIQMLPGSCACSQAYSISKLVAPEADHKPLAQGLADALFGQVITPSLHPQLLHHCSMSPLGCDSFHWSCGHCDLQIPAAGCRSRCYCSVLSASYSFMKLLPLMFGQG